MKTIILAGGSGTRLFPLSHENLPKQFIKLGGRSLFQRAIERHHDTPIYVSLKKDYFTLAKKDTEDIGAKVTLIEEPAAKNTFPAIVWSLYIMKKEYNLKHEDVIIVAPADHYVDPIEPYRKDLLIAEKLANEGNIVTFGVRPSRPDTGFGYIKLGNKIGEAYMVDEFTEKPSIEKAKLYVDSGEYMWNSGIFVFSLGTFEEECEALQPVAYRLLNSSTQEEAMELFNQLPSEPIDKAIMEKTNRTVCIPFKANWSDVGTFKGLYEVLCDDGKCAVLSGEVLRVDSEDVLVFSKDKPVIVVGLNHIAVINSEDYLLVVSLEHSQKVKEVLKLLGEK